MQSTLEDHPMDAAWQELSPLLDEAMAQLRDKDRDALVLRYFENKSLREVGDALGLQERAAQKRVARGLEKLHAFFARRGIASTTAIIANAVSAHSIQAAPVALTKSITAVAVTKGATVSGSTLTLIKGALKIMAWTKAKTQSAQSRTSAGHLRDGISGSFEEHERRFPWSNGLCRVQQYDTAVQQRKERL
jgi:activator of HSP90 ATPase